jgi:hypothetical protein
MASSQRHQERDDAKAKDIPHKTASDKSQLIKTEGE